MGGIAGVVTSIAAHAESVSAGANVNARAAGGSRSATVSALLAADWTSLMEPCEQAACLPQARLEQVLARPPLVPKMLQTLLLLLLRELLATEQTTALAALVEVEPERVQVELLARAVVVLEVALEVPVAEVLQVLEVVLVALLEVVAVLADLRGAGAGTLALPGALAKPQAKVGCGSPRVCVPQLASPPALVVPRAPVALVVPPAPAALVVPPVPVPLVVPPAPVALVVPPAPVAVVVPPAPVALALALLVQAAAVVETALSSGRAAVTSAT